MMARFSSLFPSVSSFLDFFLPVMLWFSSCLDSMPPLYSREVVYDESAVVLSTLVLLWCRRDFEKGGSSGGVAPQNLSQIFMLRENACHKFQSRVSHDEQWTRNKGMPLPKFQNFRRSRFDLCWWLVRKRELIPCTTKAVPHGPTKTKTKTQSRMYKMYQDFLR